MPSQFYPPRIYVEEEKNSKRSNSGAGLGSLLHTFLLLFWCDFVKALKGYCVVFLMFIWRVFHCERVKESVDLKMQYLCSGKV